VMKIYSVRVKKLDLEIRFESASYRLWFYWHAACEDS
jgi:hypothetical protein